MKQKRWKERMGRTAEEWGKRGERKGNNWRVGRKGDEWICHYADDASLFINNAHKALKTVPSFSEEMIDRPSEVACGASDGPMKKQCVIAVSFCMSARHSASSHFLFFCFLHSSSVFISSFWCSIFPLHLLLSSLYFFLMIFTCLHLLYFLFPLFPSFFSFVVFFMFYLVLSSFSFPFFS